MVDRLLVWLYDKGMIDKDALAGMYVRKKFSSAEIAQRLGCSISGINYWLQKYHIPKRSISEAIYTKHNPDGDPFRVNPPSNMKESFLYGLGLGLYWGEGTKRNKHSVRLANTDVRLIKQFIRFLCQIYSVKREKIKFSLQIFNDVSPSEAIQFWSKKLNVLPSRFGKPIVSVVRGPGTYKNKSQHGVLMVSVHNWKLRDIICGEIEKL